MLKCRKRQIKNLKEDIIEKRPNDRASCAAEKVGAWDTILLIHTFGVTVLYTVAPFFKEYLFAQVAAKKVIITYIVLALVCIGFAVWAYIRKSNYIIIQNEFIDAERKAELEKARNKEYENELSEQLSSFASIVSDIFVEQHNGNNSAATYAQIIANHLFLECQRRFGKDISVSIYDMNEKKEVSMKAFSTKIQRIDKPDLYHRGLVSVYDKSIKDRFYVLCLLDNDAEDEIYDLPNKKAIKTAFGFRNKRKKHTYNQYISFKASTENNHIILVEVIAHNNTVFGKEGQLRDIAADMRWRYGLLVQNYWILLTQ